MPFQLNHPEESRNIGTWEKESGHLSIIHMQHNIDFNMT